MRKKLIAKGVMLKPKIWSSSVADKKFSEAIRARDGKCLACGRTERLTCSHFWGRRCSALRYSFENCIALCSGCHLFIWEKEKAGIYRDFMIERLGQQRYDELKYIYYNAKVTRRDAIIKLMQEIGADLN